VTDPVLAAHHAYEEWDYGAYRGRGARQTDCVSHLALVLRDAGLLSFEVGDDAWLRLMVDPMAPWSMVHEVHRQLPGTVLVDHLGRVAGEVGPQVPTAGRWHAVQGWQSLTDGRVGVRDAGHALLWYAETATEGFTIESQPGTGPTIWRGRWADRVELYKAGVAWCVLPELAHLETT